MDRLGLTRQHLHGIAEGLLAGPQHRACGRIQLRVVPGGFATTGEPAVRWDGVALVVDEARTVALGPTFAATGEATGFGFAEPTNYHDHSGCTADDPPVLDPAAQQELTRALLLGDAALRVLAPQENPVLWPEHFDVAILLQGRSFGVSPGDAGHDSPYAYVSDSSLARDDFWNADFGAALPITPTSRLADLVAFWHEGLHRLDGAPWVLGD